VKGSKDVIEVHVSFEAISSFGVSMSSEALRNPNSENSSFNSSLEAPTLFIELRAFVLNESTS
jgi:hypothetical protein